jgi:hypothetical protein
MVNCWAEAESTKPCLQEQLPDVCFSPSSIEGSKLRSSETQDFYIFFLFRGWQNAGWAL